MQRAIIHVDMNAYYASIEQRCNPLLRGKPTVVVGDFQRRCIVLTASYEARPYGIQTGMLMYDAMRLCPTLQIVQGNSEKYMDCSRRILEILQSFSDLVEMSSCDEAYLDVTHCQAYWRADGAEIGKMAQDRIRDELGLPCSIGVAPNKLLAKLASEKKKPNGLTVIRPEDVEQALAETPVDELCGIGRRLKEGMRRLGIRTCKQLGEADEGFLRHHFYFWGHWLKRMGQGLDSSPVRAVGHFVAEKSMGHSTTLPGNTDDMDVLKGFLLLLSEKVAFRMRRAGVAGRVVSLYLRYEGFIHFGRQHKRKRFTDDGYEIYSTALAILESQRPFPYLVRQIGVRVADLAPNGLQHYLFEALSKKRKLNEVKDEIDLKFGKYTLKPASQLFAENFGVLDPPLPPFLKI